MDLFDESHGRAGPGSVRGGNGMAKTRTLVLNRRQTGTLISPARLEIMEAFSALGPASARDLAAHLGRPPGAVYHHVRRLEQAGLIAEVDTRRGPLLRNATKRSPRRRADDIYRWTSVLVPLGRKRA
jgi:DNA-binding transcriptional ArsR family regulator